MPGGQIEKRKGSSRVSGSSEAELGMKIEKETCAGLARIRNNGQVSKAEVLGSGADNASQVSAQPQPCLEAAGMIKVI